MRSFILSGEGRSSQNGQDAHVTIVKLYPGTSHVLRKYTSDHDHPIGEANAIYTWLSDETRCHIEEMLCMGITHDKIVSDWLFPLNLRLTEGVKLSEIQGDCYEGLYGATERAKSIGRHGFVTARDIWRIEVCAGQQPKMEAHLMEDYPEKH